MLPAGALRVGVFKVGDFIVGVGIEFGAASAQEDKDKEVASRQTASKLNLRPHSFFIRMFNYHRQRCTRTVCSCIKQTQTIQGKSAIIA